MRVERVGQRGGRGREVTPALSPISGAVFLGPIRGGRVFASSSPLGCVCMGDWRQGCLIVPAGWGAIVGRKHLPTAFGSFEGKRPKRGREPKRSNDGVPFLPGEPLCLAPVWTERATNPSGLQRGTDAHK